MHVQLIFHGIWKGFGGSLGPYRERAEALEFGGSLEGICEEFGRVLEDFRRSSGLGLGLGLGSGLGPGLGLWLGQGQGNGYA